ncbi:tyrosyl tRNA synthetase [Metamycoplasma arthritidis]|uniref:Tyrosine--tRNA ligase n=1 Tax=Metamycoplasma arthritidis (strain 158L3-1) TaxID=243272 RepID=B3PMG0_META1|nr:tyrosine--tRNA ligase [Metamycoplasma arthritidis]ACF07212.1 tyrosyl tRNA synthetase [Metamycoplasma arthritidis 158L3-1]VEU78736.1 tyrosyl tRNA synthetase [Metamycoplasma arthritidis]
MTKNLIVELKNRGIFSNISSEEKFNALESNVGVYTGFDPTAKSLHLGNYVQIVNLLRFKKFGFKPLAVLGGLTGMIGDPSYRQAERKLLDEKTILANKNAIKKQLERFGLTIFDNFAIYKDWSMLDFLRKLGPLVNINYLLSKESIATRLEKGLSFLEFSYQLIQGWDFKYLYENQNVKIQLGGSDQWGNITTGLEIIRKLHGEGSTAVAITANLLLDESGKKFGKSTGGGSLWLDKEMTSPFAIYQFLLNRSDEKVEEYLNWLTFLSQEEIKKVIDQAKNNKAARLAQKALAYEVVKDIHSQEIAEQCIKISDILFAKSNNGLTKNDLVMLRGTLPEYEIKPNQKFIEAIKASGICTSNREIREFVQKKSFAIDGVVVDNENQIISFNNFDSEFALLKKGKKEFIILIKK